MHAHTCLTCALPWPCDKAHASGEARCPMCGAWNADKATRAEPDSDKYRAAMRMLATA